MKLELKRRWLTPSSTIGELLLNSNFECWVLEDRYRPPFETKVPGQTCIPCGTYVVRRTYSPRFKMELPILENVPGFEGIRIHPGNTKLDTEGCLLPGRSRFPDRVGESRAAFTQLDEKIAKAEARGDIVQLAISIDGVFYAPKPQPNA